MIKVAILGTGNVAKHLYDAFLTTDQLEVVQVLGRDSLALEYFKKKETALLEKTNIGHADVYIIAVSDDSISSVSSLLHNKKGLVVHTSGSVPIEALSPIENRGSFYPLQTFSKARKIDFVSVPVCIEAESKEDLELLRQMASQVSGRVYEMDTMQRKSLHLAAVFANNFTNHMYYLAHEVCRENRVPFEILRPLILETAGKMETLPPYLAQTGPAKRNDRSTLKMHMDQLQTSSHRGIYQLLSESILHVYENTDET